MSFRPTDEQAEAIRVAATGETFVLDAPAGSGKSSTARGMAQKIDGRVLYLVYNRAAKEDAVRSFPRSTVVKTTSQLAWAAYAKDYADRMRPGEASRVPSWETARMAGIKPVDLGADLTLQPGSIAAMAIETIDRFCYTADPQISIKHVPPLPVGLNPAQEEYLKETVTAWARKIWTQALSPSSKHRFTMDYAFKLLVMSEPSLGFDTIIVDEAQDSNGATEKLVKDQWAQQIVIGDPAQQLYCQPLGTMVEKVHQVNQGSISAHTGSVAIEDLKVGDRVVTFDNTHVWKNGREITRVDRFRYVGPMVNVVTSSGLTSSYTAKHNCIVRIDDNLADKHVVYLMRRGDQYRIGRTRMMYSSQNKGFGIVLRGRREKADAVWILSMHDDLASASLNEMLTQHEFNIPGVHFEPADNDVVDIRAFWRKLGSNANNGEQCLSRFGLLSESPLWHPGLSQKMGIRVAFPTAAANVMSGMTMLPLRNANAKQKAPRHVWEPVTVSRGYYDGDVVSLTVDEHHNYFGDGILTHNSWRGATDIMGRFNGPRLQLTQSFRFGNAVADEAAKWLAHTETGITIKGLSSLDSVVDDEILSNPTAVLCRTNAGVIAEAIKYLSDGMRVSVVGGTKALQDLAFAAADLMAGRPCKHPELIAFKTWKELVTFSEEPGGGDLKALVNLINVYGVGDIIDACKRLVPERSGNSDIVVSTGHKSKGREWTSVQVGEDFASREPKPFENPLTGELEPGVIGRHDAMLHYVVTTRAKRHLARGGLSWIDNYTTANLEK